MIKQHNQSSERPLLNAALKEKDKKLKTLFQSALNALAEGKIDKANISIDECTPLLEEMNLHLSESLGLQGLGALANLFKDGFKEIEEAIVSVKKEIAELQAESHSSRKWPHLDLLPDGKFQNSAKVNEWSNTFLTSGFTQCGDYAFPELKALLRVFFLHPSTFATIVEHKDVNHWVEINVHNADQTVETWSNIPLPVKESVPWHTRHILQNESVARLIELHRTEHSGKERVCFSAADFVEIFQNDSRRQMKWRVENDKSENRSNTHPTPRGKSPAKAKPVHVDKSQEMISQWKKANPLLKLSKSDWSEIARCLDQWDGNKSLKEIADERVREGLQEAMKNTRGQYAVSSEEEHTALLILQSLDHFLILRGAARRIAFSDPAELAICACLDARFSWLQSYRYRKENCFGNVWPVLKGLSAGDFIVAQRFVETSFFPVREGHPDVIPLYNGVMAVLRKDMEYLNSIVPILNRHKAAQWVGAMYPCLIGIAEDSPDLVAEGLNKILATCRRSYDLKLEKIISINAHAFYNLCRWVSPKLISKFDIDRPLPWDTEYEKWVLANKDPVKFIDLKNISPILHEWVSTLCKPCFWEDKP